MLGLRRGWQPSSERGWVMPKRRRGEWLRNQRVVECLARWPPDDDGEPEPQHKTKPGQREFPWPDDSQDDCDKTNSPNEPADAETSAGRCPPEGT